MKQLFLFLLLPSLIVAQKPLSVGDFLSADILSTLKSNIQHSTLNLQQETSSLKPRNSGKLILLDFFATWCTGCIKELPKLDSLQKEFGGSFRVLLVTYQSKKVIDSFRKKNKIFASSRFPIITNDTVFKELFPHKYIPHEIWMNEQGKVLAITDQSQVNKNNILAALKDNALQLPSKMDALDFDRKKPLLQYGNGGTENDLLIRSMFTGYLPGIGKSEGLVRSPASTRYFFLNNSILFLYQAALGFDENRIILEVQEINNYIIPAEPTDEWKQNNLFSYELTLPAASKKETMKRFLLQDLNRCFDFYGRIEKRKMPCWVITRINNDSSLLKTKTGGPGIRVNDVAGDRNYANQPFKKIVASLNSQRSPSVNKPIFLDETGILFNVDITIPGAAFNDTSALKHSLEKYGLTLIQTEREIDMFVLTELKTGLTTNEQQQ